MLNGYIKAKEKASRSSEITLLAQLMKRLHAVYFNIITIFFSKLVKARISYKICIFTFLSML